MTAHYPPKDQPHRARLHGFNFRELKAKINRLTGTRPKISEDSLRNPPRLGLPWPNCHPESRQMTGGSQAASVSSQGLSGHS